MWPGDRRAPSSQAAPAPGSGEPSAPYRGAGAEKLVSHGGTGRTGLWRCGPQTRAPPPGWCLYLDGACGGHVCTEQVWNLLVSTGVRREPCCCPFGLIRGAPLTELPPGSPRAPYRHPGSLQPVQPHPQNTSTSDQQKVLLPPPLLLATLGPLPETGCHVTATRTGSCVLCQLLNPGGLEPSPGRSRHSKNTCGRRALSLPSY